MRAAVFLTLLAVTAGTPALAAREPTPMVADGEPRTCVQLNQIRSTRVQDDRTIDFEMRNGPVLRNMLPNSCPGLGFERAFGYKTSINRLCNVDIITVIHQGGGSVRGASCGLGMFQPVKPAPEPSAKP